MNDRHPPPPPPPPPPYPLPMGARPPVLASNAPVWDRRLPMEPDHAWAAYQVFRDLGLPDETGLPGQRTMKACGEKLGHANSATCSEWAGRFRWRERAASFDLAISRMRFDSIAERVATMAAEQAAIAGRMLRLASRELERLEQAQDDGLIAVESIRDLIALVDRAADLERKAVGAPIVASGGMPLAPAPAAPEGGRTWDLEALSLEELEALEVARAKAGGAEPRPVAAAPRRDPVPALPALPPPPPPPPPYNATMGHGEALTGEVVEHDDDGEPMRPRVRGVTLAGIRRRFGGA